MSDFIGGHVNVCAPYDFHRNVAVVVVTGDWWNVCGHMLLYAGGFYFHVDQPVGRPLQLDEAG